MAELGEELRRERVRRNLTFKDVEQVLHIKTTYLEAIEDGNYDIIPGQVYVKGFIRNYGNYLDLDGDRLVKAYQSQVGDIDTFFFALCDKTESSSRSYFGTKRIR